MHASEQRYGEQVGERDGLHRELWSTTDPDRTLELLRELQVSLIYVGQLERQQHPEGVAKFEAMATTGDLEVLYENPGGVIYSLPGSLELQTEGWYVPATDSSVTGTVPDPSDAESEE